MFSAGGFKPVAPLFLRVAYNASIGFQLRKDYAIAYEYKIWESFRVAGYGCLPFAALVKAGAEVGDPPAVQVRVVDNQLLEVSFFKVRLHY